MFVRALLRQVANALQPPEPMPFDTGHPPPEDGLKRRGGIPLDGQKRTRQPNRFSPAAADEATSHADAEVFDPFASRLTTAAFVIGVALGLYASRHEIKAMLRGQASPMPWPHHEPSEPAQWQAPPKEPIRMPWATPWPEDAPPKPDVGRVLGEVGEVDASGAHIEDADTPPVDRRASVTDAGAD